MVLETLLRIELKGEEVNLEAFLINIILLVFEEFMPKMCAQITASSKLTHQTKCL